MKASVYFPHRGVDGEREANLAFTINRWTGFGLPVFYADSDGDVFSRSQAINRAVERSDADVFVVADSDTILETSEQAWEAIEDSYGHDRYAVCFSELVALDWDETRIVRGGGNPQEQPVLESIKLIWGGCFAVSRNLFERVGGFDERFVGYGHQDAAFLNSCSTLGDKHRIEGTAYHLRHHAPVKHHPNIDANASLALRYREADGNKKAMLALVNER